MAVLPRSNSINVYIWEVTSTKKNQAKSDSYSFYDNVYEVVRHVPSGRVTSYGAIARYLGTGGSARMVGWAMNDSHSKGVPAHRVVNSQGLLTGKHHFGTPEQMQQLLEAEGIIVANDQVQNFKVHFWDPQIELAI